MEASSPARALAGDACTSSNLVVDVAIKKVASVALDQPTGDCHGDRPYGGALIDFSQLRDLSNGQRTRAAWRFVSSISDCTQNGQFDGAERLGCPSRQLDPCG
jgi:hypothetical protein